MPPPNLIADKFSNEVSILSEESPNGTIPPPTETPIVVPTPVATPPTSGETIILEQPPASASTPTGAPPMVPGDLVLTVDHYLIELGQPFTLTVHVSADAASASVDSLQVHLILPNNFSVLTATGGLVTEDGLIWQISEVTETTPFIANVVVQATTGQLGEVFKPVVELSAANFRPKQSEILIGIPLPNQSVTVFLDPEQSTQRSVTVARASDQERVKAITAAPSLSSQVVQTVNEPQAADQINSLYLPLLAGQPATIKPLLREDGVSLYGLWDVTSMLDASASDGIEHRATLIFSAQPLLAQGLDPHLMSVWTRQQADGKWETVPALYDETQQVFVVQTSESRLGSESQTTDAVAPASDSFSWGVGTGMSTSGHLLPSMKSFSSDEFSGQASFQIPIEAPVGVGGLSPNLRLSYSSGTADDLRNSWSGYGTQANWAGGLGWSLGGLSSIQETDGKFYLVLNNFSTELRWDTNGSYWYSDPAQFLSIAHEKPGDHTSGNSYNAGPWTITTPDGTTYYFGSDTYSSSGEPIGEWTSTYLNEIFVCNAYCWKRKGYKWHLRKVVDPLGNSMDYSYEEELGFVGGSGSACSEGTGWYDRATYLRQVSWNQGKFRIIFDRQSRLDWKVIGYSEDKDCVQAMYGKGRLSAIKVQVLTKVGGVDTWDTIHEYTLDYGTTGTDDPLNQTGSHSRLLSLSVKGEHLDNETPALLQTYQFGYTGSGHSVRMTSASNGWGGTITYEYESVAVAKVTTSSSAPDISTTPDYCMGDKCQNSASESPSFARVLAMTVSNGQGNSYRTSYQYGRMLANGMNGRFEFLGHDVTKAKQYLIVGNNAPILEQESGRWFYQHVYYDASIIDPRRGKQYKLEIHSPNDTNLLLVRYSVWNYGIANQGNWIRMEGDWGTVGAVNASGVQTGDASRVFKRFSYDGYGNVKKVEEYDQTPSIWPLPADSPLKPLRTTETEYAYNESAHIVSTPSRVRVLDANGVCLSESRTIYWDPGTNYTENNKNGNYTTFPWSTLPAKTEQAIKDCSSEPTIDQYNTDWKVTRIQRDSYGNVTTINQKGYDPTTHYNINTDYALTTQYDDIYHLFPIAQWRTGQDGAGFKEYAYYYGVNSKDWNGTNSPPDIAASDGRAFWGAMAEYCAMNNVCTRQSYDSFGRPLNRWDKVAKESNWDINSHLVTNSSSNETITYYNGATVQWVYRSPTTHPGNEFTSITEWHNPRCNGNFKRSLYDGVGQLIAEQTPQQNWGYSYEGCTVTANSSEIDILYGYNSLGNVTKTSAPTVATADWMTRINNTDWSTVWNSVAKSTTIYDALGRILKTFAPNGEETQTHYRFRQTIRVAIGRNNEPPKLLSWQELDWAGNLAYVRSGTWNGSDPVEDNKITLTHDLLGNLMSVSNSGSGATSSMTYDKLGNKLTMNDSDLGNWEYEYDRSGRLVRQTTRQTSTKILTTCLFYETRLFRLAAKEYITNTGCPVVTSLDGNNRPMSTGVNFDLQYQYDQSGNASRGQLTAVDYYDNRWDKTLTYNSSGQLASETVSIAGAPSYTSETFYDKYLRPYATKYPDDEVVKVAFNSMGSPSLLCSTYWNTTDQAYWCDTTVQRYVDAATYDETGRLTQIKLPGATSGTSDDLYRTQTYYGWTGSTGDSNRRLSAIKVGTSSGGSDRLSLSYNYDSFGNIKTLTEGYNNGSLTSSNFTYDEQNRLTNAYGKPYGYDKAGRMTNYENATQQYFAAHPHAPQTVRINEGTITNRQVVVRASGTSGCGSGMPTIQIYVNGNTDPAWQATVSSTMANYAFTLPLSGRDQIAVTFTNDCSDATGDRNLTIDYVTVATASGTVTVQAEGPTVIDRGSGSAALDGFDVLPGQQAIYWNAALRFVVAPDSGTILLKYDPNGNLSYKLTNGQADVFTFDAENHLTQIKRSGTVTGLETYVYDADGNRVKKTVGSVSTYYPFPNYEVSGTTATKYYSFNGQRVAMKSGSTLTYLHTDHLGSTVLATTSGGVYQSSDKYFAYGKDRDSANNLPTDYKFTGQKLDGSGLMYYGARYYDPQTGVFISPDTLVPDAFDVFAYNRLAYARLNPLRFNDPTGHDFWDVIATVADFASGVGAQVGYNQTSTYVPDDYNVYTRQEGESTAMTLGRHAGNGISIAVGTIETGLGATGIVAGITGGAATCLETLGGGCAAGAVVATGSAAVAVDGANTVANAVGQEMNLLMATTGSGEGSSSQSLPKVYRGGSSLTPRSIDVKIDKTTGLVQPGRGVSLYSDASKVEKFGGAFRIDSIPDELQIIQRGQDPTHFEIVPVKAMTFDRYSELLSQVVMTAK